MPTKYAGEPVPESAWNVRECTGGEVVRIAHDSARGHYVDVQTDANTFERYQHMKSIAVKVGQKVPQGATLGVAGSTGSSTARHLHFGVYRGGTKEANAINPTQWSGVPNAVGTYPGNDNIDGATPAPPSTGLVQLITTPLSEGDRKKFEELAEKLGVGVGVYEGELTDSDVIKVYIQQIIAGSQQAVDAGKLVLAKMGVNP
ncbi:M23 family metallopeptidase [Clostridia bacterium OttesenSCG-928-O13]|nr:M23 family metallopeptidase [Clostridia bacterium OttesenSCG-928-O13]